MRLCDDDGIVRSGAMHHGTDYPCTGGAHYDGASIRCTNLAHGQPQGFHAHSGWYFKRLEEGRVQITHHAATGPVERAIVVDADTWASIVASVSIDGETSVTFQRACELHWAQPPKE